MGEESTESHNEIIQRDLETFCLGTSIVAVTDDRDTTGWLILYLENGAQLHIQTADPLVIVDPIVH